MAKRIAEINLSAYCSADLYRASYGAAITYPAAKAAQFMYNTALPNDPLEKKKKYEIML